MLLLIYNKFVNKRINPDETNDKNQFKIIKILRVRLIEKRILMKQ